jgi:hypothetical protein
MLLVVAVEKPDSYSVSSLESTRGESCRQRQTMSPFLLYGRMTFLVRLSAMLDEACMALRTLLGGT